MKVSAILRLMLILPTHFSDIDECFQDTDGCAQTCTNTNGSFSCSCDIGYTLATDDIGCDGRLRS